jgi:hypothetical protein
MSKMTHRLKNIFTQRYKGWQRHLSLHRPQKKQKLEKKFVDHLCASGLHKLIL